MANGSPGLYVISGANLQAQKIRVKFKYVITLEKIEVDNPPRPLFIGKLLGLGLDDIPGQVAYS
jgi:hypothetical protein